MKQTVSFNAFHDAFQAIRPDNFSYDGLRVLYDWFEELDESCGTETELDVIAICCEFSESTALEIADNYSIDLKAMADDGIDCAEWINERTLVCGETTDTIVYQDF